MKRSMEKLTLFFLLIHKFHVHFATFTNFLCTRAKRQSEADQGVMLCIKDATDFHRIFTHAIINI